MSGTNPVFNNQIDAKLPGTYIVTSNLKTAIVKQLHGKTVREQEAIIETLLQLLDVNLLTALNMAYGAANVGVREKTKEEEMAANERIMREGQKEDGPPYSGPNNLRY